MMREQAENHAYVDMDKVVRDHPITRERAWFSTRLRCRCGWQSDRIWHGITFSSIAAMLEAGHWASLLGVSMFRTVDDIHAGR